MPPPRACVVRQNRLQGRRMNDSAKRFCDETKQCAENNALTTSGGRGELNPGYSRSMRLFRLRSRRALRDMAGSSSSYGTGNGGSSIIG
jgi:hypothetical protein